MPGLKTPKKQSIFKQLLKGEKGALTDRDIERGVLTDKDIERVKSIPKSNENGVLTDKDVSRLKSLK